MAEAAEQGVLDAARLAAVGEVWRNQGRTLETSFGGTSMLPAITPSDVLRIACGADFASGDVILYLRDERVVVHRVVRVDGGDVWTRGDANLLPDPPVSLQRVIGRVMALQVSGNWEAIAARRPSVIARALSRLPAGVIIRLWRVRWSVSRVALALWRRRPGAGSSRT